MTSEKKSFDTLSLSDEGAAILANGKTPEFQLFEATTPEGVESSELEVGF